MNKITTVEEAVKYLTGDEFLFSRVKTLTILEASQQLVEEGREPMRNIAHFDKSLFREHYYDLMCSTADAMAGLEYDTTE